MDKKLIIRYILLILGVTIMSLGIALSLKSTLGTPPISCIPAVFCLFGTGHSVLSAVGRCRYAVY